MDETIFLKIIAREAPSQIVYEDDDTIAFLSNQPNVPGHTLVIPKERFLNIFDIPEETLAKVMGTVRKIAPAVRDAVGAKAVHINSNHGEEAGQVVGHIHFHIIPRHERNEFTFCWPHIEYKDGESAEVAERIRTNIR